MRSFILSAAAALALMLPAGQALSQAQQNFTLVNRSGQQIDEVYVSPTSADQWGRDILGDGVMPSGMQREITFPQRTRACNFDLKVVFNGGQPSEARNVNLCEVSTITVGRNGQMRAD